VYSIHYRYDCFRMWRYFHFPFGAETHRRSMKHGSMTDAVGFAGGMSLSSGKVAEARQRHAQVREVERPTANLIEMKIWAVLFVLIILATITLIVLVLMDEPARAHAALSYPSWIACSPVLFFS